MVGASVLISMLLSVIGDNQCGSKADIQLRLTPTPGSAYEPVKFVLPS